MDKARQIKNFYDRYPYPQPIESLKKYRQLWGDRKRRQADYHMFFPTNPFKEDLSILIAGCGTSQAAKYAIRWPQAKVTGIDVSTTSITHTQKLKEKYGLKNLQIIQLAIERVDEIGEDFDYIVSTGVLHHLVDPGAGLKALGDVLKTQGVMHLMVYAQYGRTGIYMIQEFCRQLEIRPSEMEISDLVTALKELPSGHPLEFLLRKARDFQNEGELADALLHPQDRAYSVTQVFELIENAGLKFGRWIRQAPYDVNCGIMEKLPQSSRLLKLSLQEQYAVAELFRGTMVRHSMTVYHNDSQGGLTAINFEGDNWLNFIPIRLHDTICVHEKLPKNCAAVLINQNHTYSDLILTINEKEKKLFDAIDGSSTIKTIVDTAFKKDNEKLPIDLVKKFFIKLWQYDQIVFNLYQH